MSRPAAEIADRRVLQYHSWLQHKFQRLASECGTTIIAIYDSYAPVLCGNATITWIIDRCINLEHHAVQHNQTALSYIECTHILDKFTKPSTMSQYELYYFPVRGRGQAIRYLFLDNDIKYKEVNTGKDWMTEFKPIMPFGQSPMLRDGDFDVAQSCAILRYLGRKHNLYPTDPQEAAKLDMISDHIEDIRGPYVRMIYQNYDDGKDAYIKTLPETLGYIEKLFNKWGNDFITSKIAIVDYNLLDLFEILTILSPTCLDAFPKLKAYFDRMQARPGLAKYRETEEFKGMPVNGNDKQ